MNEAEIEQEANEAADAVTEKHMNVSKADYVAVLEIYVDTFNGHLAAARETLDADDGD